MSAAGISSPSSITLRPSGWIPAASPTVRTVKAAREFEAQLIGTILESMEKTFAALPGQDSIPGADDYNDLGIHALAQGMAEHGGFGLAKMLIAHLPHEGTEQARSGSFPGNSAGATKVLPSPADRTR